jgi:hypothetical protein
MFSNDPFCISSKSLSTCDECVKGYFANSKLGSCEILSILCKDYIMLTGLCTSCLEGNVLQNGICFLPALGVDLNCLKY